MSKNRTYGTNADPVVTFSDSAAPRYRAPETKVPTKKQRTLSVKAVTAVLNGPETDTYHLYRRGNVIYFAKMKSVHKESA